MEFRAPTSILLLIIFFLIMTGKLLMFSILMLAVIWCYIITLMTTLFYIGAIKTEKAKNYGRPVKSDLNSCR